MTFVGESDNRFVEFIFANLYFGLFTKFITLNRVPYGIAKDSYIAMQPMWLYYIYTIDNMPYLAMKYMKMYETT